MDYGILDGTSINDKKGLHLSAAPSLGISLARLEFAIKSYSIEFRLLVADLSVVLEELQ
jgi:hypothetical protein